MSENPESKTTKDFIEYHKIEKNNPQTLSGEPDFTYLIGKKFILENWVKSEDIPTFLKLIIQTDNAEPVVSEGDITWYIAQIGDNWIAWDDADPKPHIGYFDTREDAIKFHRNGFIEKGLPEDCWLLPEE